MPNAAQTRTLAEMQEARENLETQLTALVDDDTRDLTSEDTDTIISLQRQISEESQAIEAEQRREQARLIAAEHRRRRDRSARPPDSVEGQARKFDWLKFLRGAMEGNHEGLEAELSQEGAAEARNSGHATGLSNPLPSSFLRATQRDFSAGTSTEGKETVPTDLGALIPALTPKLGVMKMGATMLNLTNPLNFPRENSLMSAGWKGEKGTADETTSTFDDIDLTPHRLAAWTEFTKDLLFQSSISIGNFVRDRLSSTIKRKLDKDLLIGDGQTGAILGLLGIANTNNANVGGSGATPDWSDIVNFWKELAIDNADVENLQWLTNPTVAHALMTTVKASGTDSTMLLDKINGDLGGYPINISTQVPADLTDSSYEDQSALIFGNWKDFLVAQFSGLDVIVDPFTKGKEAMVQVIIHSWWDCDVNHPESFAIAKDIGGTVV